MRIREILGIIGEEILKIRAVYIFLFNGETTQRRILAVTDSKRLRLTLDLRSQDSNMRSSLNLWSFYLLQFISLKISYISIIPE